MPPVVATPLLHPGVPFRDGFGERRPATDGSGQARTLLCLRPALTAVPSFEFALRERVARLSEFRHRAFITVVGVERVIEEHASLAVVSQAADGLRLAELFTRAAACGVNVDINAALCITRQLTHSLAILQEACPDIVHGAVAPERLVITPTGRLLVADYALGAALTQLRYSQSRLWRELRVAVPTSRGVARVDSRGDVVQLGLVALSLILGRALRDEEYPNRLTELVRTAKAIAPKGGFEPLPAGVRQWLAATLGLDAGDAVADARAAHEALERLLKESRYQEPASGLGGLLARVGVAGARASLPAMAPLTAPADPPSAMASHLVVVGSPKSMPVVDEDDDPMLAFNTEQELGLTRAAAPRGEIGPTEFESEHRPAVTPPSAVAADLFVTATAHTASPTSARWLAGVLLVAALTGAAFPISRWLRASPWWTTLTSARFTSPMTAPGVLVVTTYPPGVPAWLDGRAVGETPLTLALAPGQYVLELRHDGGRRAVPVRMTAGSRLEQYIDMPVAPAESARVLPEP